MKSCYDVIVSTKYFSNISVLKTEYAWLAEDIYEGKVIVVKAWDEAMFWKTNKAWYRANYEADRYELTSEAPDRAVASFRLYLLRNDLPIDNANIRSDANSSSVAVS